MRRATTPKLAISIDVDLRDCWYRVVFAQTHGAKVVKNQNDCELSEDGKTIYVQLSQEETLLFSDRYKVNVQIRYGKDSSVCATNIVMISVDQILDEEVIR